MESALLLNVAPLYPNYTKFCVDKYNLMKSPCAKFQVFSLKSDVTMTINFLSLRYMGILTFRHCDVKMTSYDNFFMNLNSELKIALSAKFELFFNPKNDVTHWKQKVAMATSDYNGY